MGPLAGIRVVDFSRVLAGPHCAQNLLDLGAEVIKIEPPSGDISRRAFPRQGEISGYYAQQNAGKRNISIDLNVAGAREIALRLCDDADILVENFRPARSPASGWGTPMSSHAIPRHLCLDQWLRTTRPMAGPVSLCPDSAGRDRHHEAVERTLWHPTDRARSDSLSHGDIYAGLHATIAILAALNERSDTGPRPVHRRGDGRGHASDHERVHVDLSTPNSEVKPPSSAQLTAHSLSDQTGKWFVSQSAWSAVISFPFYLAQCADPTSPGTRVSPPQRIGVGSGCAA